MEARSYLPCSILDTEPWKLMLLKQSHESEPLEVEPRGDSKERGHEIACTFLDARMKIEARTVHA